MPGHQWCGINYARTPINKHLTSSSEQQLWCLFSEGCRPSNSKNPKWGVCNTKICLFCGTEIIKTRIGFQMLCKRGWGVEGTVDVISIWRLYLPGVEWRNLNLEIISPGSRTRDFTVVSGMNTVRPWMHSSADESIHGLTVADFDVILILRLYLPGVEPGISRA